MAAIERSAVAQTFRWEGRCRWGGSLTGRNPVEVGRAEIMLLADVNASCRGQSSVARDQLGAPNCLITRWTIFSIVSGGIAKVSSSSATSATSISISR